MEHEFFGRHTPHDLLRQWGSPLYVYNEAVFRDRARAVRAMSAFPRFAAQYSVKANTNLALLRIAREEGLAAEVTGPGEILACEHAGYTPDEIFWVANNAGADEFAFALSRGVLTSVDSLSQLETLGKTAEGGPTPVALRFNPGVGSGHHAKVVTGGKATKFGFNESDVAEIKSLAKTYNLRIVGINQHIGSGVLDVQKYMDSVGNILVIARNFEGLSFIDVGGGFGIPYRKSEGQQPLDLAALGAALTDRMTAFEREYGSPLTFKIEPGRYVVAESGVLLGTVNAVKWNDTQKYIGTDLGFSVFARTTMYDGVHHDIDLFCESDGLRTDDAGTENAHVVGNICETGDYIAKDRVLPMTAVGDALAVRDAGAYGYCMASNYNSRPRPAEVLLCADGTVREIRRRETMEGLLAGQIF